MTDTKPTIIMTQDLKDATEKLVSLLGKEHSKEYAVAHKAYAKAVEEATVPPSVN